MIDDETKTQMLRDLEHKIERWLVRRLMGAEGLKRMVYHADDSPHIDINLDDYPQSIRVTIRAEWIDRKDATE